ncbi:MAG: helix-turn-helix domain-containing protein [Pseudomonadota bacterium]|nr:helix-turn-helix domain-containing protein [Pseudomonadota bacterium]
MTPSLIRAARALLDWPQEQLALKAGLSLSAVNLFERGSGHTRSSTVQKMVAALKQAGIDFPAAGGVRHADEITGVLRIKGDNFVERLDEDIYAAVTRPGDEIYSCSADESQWFVPGIKQVAERYYKWRAQLGVRQLYLVPEGNTVFESPKAHYRLCRAHDRKNRLYHLWRPGGPRHVAQKADLYPPWPGARPALSRAIQVPVASREQTLTSLMLEDRKRSPESALAAEIAQV